MLVYQFEIVSHSGPENSLLSQEIFFLFEGYYLIILNRFIPSIAYRIIVESKYLLNFRLLNLI